jgi:acetyl/propionyl-CoA carboxylase alpha subunit
VTDLSLRKDTAGRGATRPFDRVLVANRGEIALRIIRACHEMGMEAVAVYSDSDAEATHVRAADLAVRLGPPAPTESYLRIDRVVEAALRSGAQAVHPGYGFLAERAAFARACEDAGLTFVGPPSGAIEALGDKLAARRTAASVDVPSVPGTLEPVPVDRPDQVAAIVEIARGIGFPIMVKAAAGGGGRGMRRVDREQDLAAALAAGSAEAASAFGDGSVYLERVISPARHIEVQLLGDVRGKVVALGERDCSIQRRHQKLIEEAPAPGLTTEQRRHLHDRAVRVTAAAGLRNAATCEFLHDPAGEFHFLEVNTRLQVEHGVTELVSGLDIVREQFWLAAGAPLSEAALAAAAHAAEPTSHAIEVRLSAEDPARGFAPTPGRVGRWTMPSGPGIRVDTAIEPGGRVPPEYDNLIAKLMVHAGDRPTAIARLRRALDELEIGGIQTTAPFHRFVTSEPDFIAGRLSTGYVDEHWDGAEQHAVAARAAQLAAALVVLEPTPAASDGRAAAAIRSAGPMSGSNGSRSNGRGVGPAFDGGSAWRRAGRAAGRDRWPKP